MSHKHVIAASKATQCCRLQNAPLVRVDGAVVIRVHRREGGLEARRYQQVLQVLIAAVHEEVDNFFVAANGDNHLLLLERAGLVDVDHLEHLSSGAQELDGEVLVLGSGRLLAALALVRQLVQALGEAAVDRLLPCAQINQ